MYLILLLLRCQFLNAGYAVGGCAYFIAVCDDTDLTVADVDAGCAELMGMHALRMPLELMMVLWMMLVWVMLRMVVVWVLLGFVSEFWVTL
jgi:hypothetical protein